MSQMIRDQCCLYELHLEKKAADIQGKQPCASIYSIYLEIFTLLF